MRYWGLSFYALLCHHVKKGEERLTRRQGKSNVSHSSDVLPFLSPISAASIWAARSEPFSSLTSASPN